MMGKITEKAAKWPIEKKTGEKPEKKKIWITRLTVVLFLISMYMVGRETAVYVTGRNVVKGEKTPYLVVIDAGHGGMDPGKIGINDVAEKEINLSIALKVKKYLEFNDVRVVMTRESDQGLNDPDASNKKVQDMKRRLAMIEETAPDLAVSIHQNSYPEEYVHGAQVFYYADSPSGKQLAELLQAQFVKKADPDNTRQIKANDSYYLLKKTSVPIVIAECGFLSNREEAEKLCSEAYQEKIAWAICVGILQHLNMQ